jgi:hypothetical protein
LCSAFQPSFRDLLATNIMVNFVLYLDFHPHAMDRSGIEYWQHADPSHPTRTRQCSADGEDPTCSASIPSKGFTPAHFTVRCMFDFGPVSYSRRSTLVFELPPLSVFEQDCTILSSLSALSIERVYSAHHPYFPL